MGEPTSAAEWMARLRSDRATAEDRDAYRRWLQARPENRTSATSLDQLWQFTGLLEDDPLVQEVLAAPPRRIRGGWWTRSTSRLAAGVVLGLSLTAAMFFAWHHLDADRTYETASGEQRVVDLADGSRIYLNVKTRIEVELRSDVRNIRLAHGQAFFEVFSDPLRPFVVTAGDKEIKVLGTKFDVLLEAGDTRVTVLEGRVAVTSLDSIVEDAHRSPSTKTETKTKTKTKTKDGPFLLEQEGLADGESDSQTVDVAQRLELNARDAISWPWSANPSQLAGPPALESVEAWVNGRVVFHETPLRQAIAELNRYTPVEIRLASVELGSMTVSGVFYIDRLADVDSLVFALENSLPVDTERRDGEFLLLASR